MPDVWTNNPEKLRDIMIESGAVCGAEPRVLKPRDAEWTCHIDSKGWLRDMYIHPVTDLMVSYSYFYCPLIIALIVGIFIGLGWGKHFWRPAKGK